MPRTINGGRKSNDSITAHLYVMNTITWSATPDAYDAAGDPATFSIWLYLLLVIFVGGLAGAWAELTIAATLTNAVVQSKRFKLLIPPHIAREIRRRVQDYALSVSVACLQFGVIFALIYLYSRTA